MSNRIMNRGYANKNDSATGSDELIVQLMKDLIGLTDQHIISAVRIEVQYHSPAVNSKEES